MNRINVHQNISLNPLPWYLCGKQTCQDRTDEIKCQFCMQKATPTGSTQGFWISTRKIGECGAAVKSVTAKDKRGRKNKRTDRSVFTALCLFTVRQAKLAISFSVPPEGSGHEGHPIFLQVTIAPSCMCHTTSQVTMYHVPLTHH